MAGAEACQPVRVSLNRGEDRRPGCLLSPSVGVSAPGGGARPSTRITRASGGLILLVALAAYAGPRVTGRAVAETSEVTPLLEQLRVAVSTVNTSSATGRAAGEAGRAALQEIRRLLAAIEASTGNQADSARRLRGQEAALVATMGQIVGDVESALADARRIREHLEVARLP